MRDNLDCSAQIVAAALFFQDSGIDFSSCHIIELSQIDIDKALIVAKIQIRFGAIACNENFTVLVWAHGSRVNVDIGVKLLNGDIQASVFQQAAQRRSGDPFSQ
ncbi:Uncharacterised protein [Mycobacteroides abscessus subsp. abscessus]|nr:Uncharacterised protein [Mycobacteroides abscessus subsp. abscessus]